MPIDTVFLDAGGVLVFPSWARVAETLARHGLTTTADALAAVEWHAKHEVDTRARGELDVIRGWLVFEKVFAHAGVVGPATITAALADLQGYHAEFNLWEHVPADVVPALQRLRASGRKLVVVSNANGRMRAALERIGSRPETTVHVGDLFHTDVVGARAAGLRAVLLDIGDLYGDHDCERVRSLAELADLLERPDG
jgi:FMN phosphatase YigB (HAD superfamily)